MEDKKLEILLTAMIQRLDVIAEQGNVIIEGLDRISELLELEEETLPKESTEENETDEDDEEETTAKKLDQEKKKIKTVFKKREEE